MEKTMIDVGVVMLRLYWKGQSGTTPLGYIKPTL